MISGQIDRLRKAAQTYRDFGKHEAEQMLLDAADTIWQLRDDLQQANAENAKLWELVRDMYKFMSIAEELNAHIKLAPSETCSFANRMRELGIEVPE